MKLIAKRKDYYDHFARDRQMSDQSYTWNREPEVVDIRFSIPAPVYMATHRLIRGGQIQSANSTEAIGLLFFFCGRVIPVAKIIETKPSRYGGQEKIIRFVFSIDEIPEVLLPKDEKTRKWSAKTTMDFFPFGRMQILFSLANTPWMASPFKDTLKLPGQAIAKKMSLDDMHRELKTPVFCHAACLREVLGDGDESRFHEHDYSPKVVINPILSAIGLQKVIDPFTAFQEIDRYLTNELAPKDVKRDMSIIDKSIPDKIKAESHGFNKHSFRKDPSKKSKRGQI